MTITYTFNLMTIMATAAVALYVVALGTLVYHGIKYSAGVAATVVYTLFGTLAIVITSAIVAGLLYLAGLPFWMVFSICVILWSLLILNDDY